MDILLLLDPPAEVRMGGRRKSSGLVNIGYRRAGLCTSQTAADLLEFYMAPQFTENGSKKTE